MDLGNPASKKLCKTEFGYQCFDAPFNSNRVIYTHQPTVNMLNPSNVLIQVQQQFKYDKKIGIENVQALFLLKPEHLAVLKFVRTSLNFSNCIYTTNSIKKATFGDQVFTMRGV